jgi:hypothetical protein
VRFVIRAAEPEEAPALTRLAHAAKAHWGYPPAWLAQSSAAGRHEVPMSPETAAVIDIGE